VHVQPLDGQSTGSIVLYTLLIVIVASHGKVMI